MHAFNMQGIEQLDDVAAKPVKRIGAGRDG
jgi:hypothetical protein